MIDWSQKITAAEKETQRIQQLADSARSKRDRLITETDYVMMPDYPISELDKGALEDYRQALRDVPQQSGFPESIVWPEFPEVG